MCLSVPGKIIRTTDVAGIRMAQVDVEGVRRDVCLAYVPEARAGDYVLVSLGFAVEVVAEADARSALELLRALGDDRRG